MKFSEAYLFDRLRWHTTAADNWGISCTGIQVVDSDTRWSQNGSVVAGEMIEAGLGDTVKCHACVNFLRCDAAHIDNVAFGFLQM